MPPQSALQNPLQYPYDLYQRYHLASQIIELLDNALSTEAPILEVGGDPGVLASFLPNENPTIVNTPPHAADGVLPADGSDLPFKSHRFRGTLVLDVLEHVPQQQRHDFLTEIDRVSTNWAVVGGPFQHQLVEEAESILSNFYQELTGKPHQYLDEHRDIGLPDQNATVQFLQSLSYNTLVIPNGLLWRWMLVMGITMFLQKDPGDRDLTSQIYQFVNKNLAPDDNREPAYRHLIVAAKSQLPQSTWHQIQRLEKPMSRLPEEDFTAAWEGCSAALQSLIADKLRQRDQHIRKLQGEIDILKDFQNRVQRTVPYHIYHWWKRLWKRR